MVKADVKRDYYADLDLPQTADGEEIKRQFRLLAKQFHPDRNPGREVDVLPKFQAVQAAHEILSDPVEKAKYDAARAKLAGRTYASDPYGFARSTNAKPPTSTAHFPFPPPPKPNQKRPPFPSPNQRAQTSSGADKFNAFARGAPQSWDRTRFDEARAEAARMFPNMRPSPTAPPVPPRTPRQAPTAPKPTSSSDLPHVPNIPPPGFPGLSRTQSARKQGYTSGAHGADEAQAPRSAYSYVRGDRTSGPTAHGYVPDDHMRSPPVTRARPAVSPLRHTRSSDYDMRSDPLGGSRPSSKYSGVGGERTDIHGDGLHRSTSVRNSPIDPRWDDRGPFGRPSAHFDPQPRHRSASPGMRPNGIHADFSSESSSSEDEELNMKARPKAVPRSRVPGMNPFGKVGESNPGLTGQFPNTNYTRIVEDGQYKNPTPDLRDPARKPFPDMTSPDVETPRSNGVHGNGGHGGNADGPKYDSSQNPPYYPWMRTSRQYRATTQSASFNGVPSWAVPSTVFPQMTPPRPRKQENDRPHARYPSMSSPLHSSKRSSKGGANLRRSHDRGPSNVQTKFSAAEWHDKVTAEDFLRPVDAQMRKSPSKSTRAGSKPATTRGRGQSRGLDAESGSSSDSASGRSTRQRDGTSDEDKSDKAAAFQRGKLPDDWASKVNTAATHPPPPPAASRTSQEAKDDPRDRYVVVEEDVMDVDDTPPSHGTQPTHGANPVQPGTTDAPRQTVGRRPTNGGGVDLKEFAQQAPFAPASTGLKDLGDIATHLPFESRPEASVDTGSKAAARLRALNLPKPPKPVVPPAVDRLDQSNWLQYVDHMSAYMKDWNRFNAKMIEHFRSRQDRICGTMSQNWVSMRGDGPDADSLDDKASSHEAGYAAYMQWLKDDAQCRDWWDHAHEEHMKCMEDLGRTREATKKKLRTF
ncbi:hypothetical protein A1O1_04822 [Capronia coronata CBS 617.96]|uniref:J domain-containing protein n=1 Tax=Capronia coronata CBS 617.96 TaxID=1182541 RepID=W9YE28_9EURO|nr:uncharacterized protein A1O1_04822 [Capronia coronata CBS 617.96]EXJ87895.1 hypothetical protein A1O1_04822 [Capronia coronata CBS 617.96]